ncbi:MAG: YtxH domain-containing protein [Ruminococcus sp.]|nr:YtxH domain-containing protein [Ruminococcus sp.]
MKKVTMLTAAALAAGIMLTACSASDGRISDKQDSRADNAVTTEQKDRARGDSSSERRVATTTRRAETSTSAADRRDSEDLRKSADSEADKMKDKAESLADDAKDKADEISDDVADGINGGLDAAESLVDDVLR